MSVRHFRWPFLLLTVGWFFWADTIKTPLGLSQSCVNGVCHFEAGTDPRAIALAVGMIALYAVLLYAPPARLGRPMTSLWRRFVGFWLDFIFFMAASSPFDGIAPTLMEWRRTGVFAWSFSRDVSAPYDGWLAWIEILLGFLGMALYFALPLVRGRPSPGSCMMGYQIVAGNGETMTMKQALKRVFFGFIAVCSAHRFLYQLRNKKESSSRWTYSLAHGLPR